MNSSWQIQSLVLTAVQALSATVLVFCLCVSSATESEVWPIQLIAVGVLVTAVALKGLGRAGRTVFLVLGPVCIALGMLLLWVGG